MTLALRRDGALETLCEVPAQPSGLGVLPDGRLLVVSTRTPSATPLRRPHRRPRARRARRRDNAAS
jgi:hypothetical protein